MLPFVLLVELDEAMRRLIVDSLSGFAYVVCYSDPALLLESPPYDFSAAIVSSQIASPEFVDGIALAEHLQGNLGLRILLLIPPNASAPENKRFIRKGMASIGIKQRLRAFAKGDSQ